MPDCGAARLRLTHDVYDPAAVAEAAKAYANHLHVTIIHEARDETELALQNFRGSPATEHVSDEFLNFLLDLSIRRKLKQS